ncbi:DUF6376 family protein [Bacillus marasmi]|uniref:DUF6376 family protein n=1 Tax=Bacillus marasmi TaxID=1926279 RepID=UPI0011C78689|nr:DUF6376 family protein [Bacillus marasmi]
MKKWFTVLFAGMLILLGGCNVINEAKNTVTYIDQAIEFINTATDFANDAPPLAKRAVEDTQAATELETMLLDMKNEIEEFNSLQAPEIAADLHQQIVDNNTVVLNGINLYLESIEDGKLDPAILENTEIFQTINDMSGLINELKKLGN